MKKSIRILLTVCLLGLASEPVYAMGLKKATRLLSKNLSKKIYKVVGFTTGFGLGYKFFSLKKFKTEEKDFGEMILDSVKKSQFSSLSEQDLVNFIRNNPIDDEVVKIIFNQVIGTFHGTFTKDDFKWGSVYEEFMEKDPHGTILMLSSNCSQQLRYQKYAKESEEVATFMRFLNKHPKLLPLVLYDYKVALHLPHKEFVELLNNKFDDMSHQIKRFYKSYKELPFSVLDGLIDLLNHDDFRNDVTLLQKVSPFIFSMSFLSKGFYDCSLEICRGSTFKKFINTHFDTCGTLYLNELQQNLVHLTLKGARIEMERVLEFYEKSERKEEFEPLFKMLIEEMFLVYFNKSPLLYGAFFEKRDHGLQQRVIKEFLKNSTNICKEGFLDAKVDKIFPKWSGVPGYWNQEVWELMQRIVNAMASDERELLSKKLVSKEFIEVDGRSVVVPYYTALIGNLLKINDKDITARFENYFLDRLKSSNDGDFRYSDEFEFLCAMLPCFSKETFQKVVTFALKTSSCFYLSPDALEMLIKRTEQFKMDKEKKQLQELQDWRSKLKNKME